MTLQTGFIVHHSRMSTITSNPDGNLTKVPGADPSSKFALEREIVALREIREVNPDARIPALVSTQKGEKLSLSMSRLGSHDLRDVMHEIPSSAIPSMFLQMANDIQSVHLSGFVHRDIKPGNFMAQYSPIEMQMEYRGMIDFGMAMRVNRKQDSPSCLGGTSGYSHPSQLSKIHKDVRCHPGQDWFAFGRTIAHILVGGSEASFKSGIEAYSLLQKIENAILGISEECNWFDSQSHFFDLISYTLEMDSYSPESLEKLGELGKKIIASNPDIPAESYRFSPQESGFQKMAEKRPFRHDMLVIVDSTDSMADEIADLRQALIDVESELRDMPLDLRVDVWALSDYDRNGGQDPVKVIGRRVTSSALYESFKELAAESPQIDQAEAYEAALQDAYLTEKWSPRNNSVRSIVLVGDSYPHGWLTKDYWGQYLAEMKDGKSWYRPDGSFDPEDHSRKHSLFIDRHPLMRERPWEWGAIDERTARKEARRVRSESDHYSGRRHVEVPSSSGTRKRPNVLNAIEKCVSQRGATIHTIFAGENLVSRGFMKFTAMVGEGTFTQISNGELKIALRALFASPDKELFAEFRQNLDDSEASTQVLNSITSFVMD